MNGAPEPMRRLSVFVKPLEPGELVVEFGAGRGIAIGKIKASDGDAGDGGFDIAAVGIFRIAGQAAPGFHGIGAAREYRDAVPCLLSVPDRPVSGLADIAEREFLLRRFQFLKAYDVGLRFREPAQQDRQSAIHSIHIVGRDFHRDGAGARVSMVAGDITILCAKSFGLVSLPAAPSRRTNPLRCPKFGTNRLMKDDDLGTLACSASR